MSRPLRIEYDDAYYHVMNRGRGGQAIFHNADYCEMFYIGLQEAHQRFGLEVHTYCLMNNHYHLLVKTPQGNLQRAMRHIGGMYTQRYNRLKQTDGTLFRGRYKAILVDSEAYLLQLSKYIHRNPVEAGMVYELKNYLWSSYLSYISEQANEPWLFRQDIYDQLGVMQHHAMKYKAYVLDSSMPGEISRFYSKKNVSPILGSSEFIADVKRKFATSRKETTYSELSMLRPTMPTIVEAVCQQSGVSTDTIMVIKKGRGKKNQPRKIAMYLAQLIGGYRLKDIAKHFGLSHYGGASNAIQSIKTSISKDEVLKESINTIIKRLDPNGDFHVV